jgi:hypothetical protein
MWDVVIWEVQYLRSCHLGCYLGGCLWGCTVSVWFSSGIISRGLSSEPLSCGTYSIYGVVILDVI